MQAIDSGFMAGIRAEPGRGAAAAQGAQKPQGAQGTQGTQKPQGAQGAQGAQGVQKPRGTEGAQNLAYVPGDPHVSRKPPSGGGARAGGAGPRP